MNVQSILTLVLALAPPETTPGEEPSAELLSADSWAAMSYEQVIEQLTHGIEIGDRRPEEAISILEPALEALPRLTPQLANDPAGLELRAEAYVSLARAHLTNRDEDKAREAMDEGIRSAPFGQELPAERYGPKVEKLWENRIEALEERAREYALVTCWVECRVYLNERLVEGVDSDESVVLGGLTAGSYRLWVEAVDGTVEPVIEQFEARELGGQPLDFTLGAEPVPVIEGPEEEPDPDPILDDDPVVVGPPPGKRPLLPRAAEISAVAAGVGLIVSGAVLFAISDKCANPEVKGAVLADGIEACPRLWDTGVAGIALMGAGAGMTALGSVFLGIDEVRRAKGKKHARVTVGWTFRF